jgi:hypothetical protein
MNEAADSAPPVAASEAPQELSVAPSETVPSPGEELTSANYPYSFKGEQYNNREEMLSAMSIDIADYPTEKEYAVALGEAIENWINSGLDQTNLHHSHNFVPSTDKYENNLQAITSTVYNGVFAEATINFGSETQSALLWRDEINALHAEQTKKWLESQSSGTPAEATVTLNYSGTYSKDGENPSDPDFAILEAVSFTIDDGVEGSEPQELTFMPKIVVDENGKWKITEVHEAQVLD